MTQVERRQREGSALTGGHHGTRWGAVPVLSGEGHAQDWATDPGIHMFVFWPTADELAHVERLACELVPPVPDGLAGHGRRTRPER